MSRVGKQPIKIPEGVSVELEDRKVVISGPKGQLALVLPEKILVLEKEGYLLVSRANEAKKAKANHGTIRSLINNMVLGVTQNWSKELEVIGTGFRVDLSGQRLDLKLGFSHPVIIDPPPGVVFEAKDNKIKISGPDKTLVGNLAAKIRKIRPPDVYKGKGVRYLGETIKLKPGKAAKVGTAQ
ncbi:MAG: 50S ribosomal protein L6 [Patescibacteria group bacterium]|nr:50S ribosomal protein L6 [Patescibacteria group bacterium]